MGSVLMEIVIITLIIAIMIIIMGIGNITAQVMIGKNIENIMTMIVLKVVVFMIVGVGAMIRK